MTIQVSFVAILVALFYAVYKHQIIVAHQKEEENYIHIL